MYSDYSRPLGIEHHLRLCLPAGPGPLVGPGRTVELIFFRGPGPDFSERDRTLLALLRPHLHQAYLDAERRRRGPPPRSPADTGNCCTWSPQAYQRPDRPSARRVGGNRAQTLGEHLQQAAGIQPHRRGHPRLPRPSSRVAAAGGVTVANLASTTPTRRGDGPSTRNRSVSPASPMTTAVMTMATERASFGLFLFVSPDASSRTRAPSRQAVREPAHRTPKTLRPRP